MKIIVSGAAGRMGSALCVLAEERGIGVVRVARNAEPAAGVYRRLRDCREGADALVDFSSHEATGEVLKYCLSHRLPAVLAATGQTEEERGEIVRAAAELPIFFCANLSLGMALAVQFVRRAARLFPTADTEIVEIHHNRKFDVPSGSAKLLAEAVCAARGGGCITVGRHGDGRRAPGEISVHSLRLGNEVGTHTVTFCTGSETLTLTHAAHDKTLFCDGALRAAEFLGGRAPGLYDMSDLLAESEKGVK